MHKKVNYPIVITRNDSDVLDLVWKNSNGPLDLAGITGKVQIRTNPDSKLLSEHVAIMQREVLGVGVVNATASFNIILTAGTFASYGVGSFISFGSITGIYKIIKINSLTSIDIDKPVTLTNDTHSLVHKGRIEVSLNKNLVAGCHSYGLETVSGGMARTIMGGKYIIEKDGVK